MFHLVQFRICQKSCNKKQERLTNEKIFQQTTQKNTSQGVIRETNDAAKTKKEDSEIEKKAVEDFMKTYYERVQKNDLENLKNMVEDTNELTEDQKESISM